MGKREEIYTVHVKCRPDPRQNYPSERAYSSSTVGGLALTHLTLGAVGTTLYSVAYVNFGRGTVAASDLVGGVLLVSSCLLAFSSGILASRRWYVDRYIRWYFAACLFSATSSALSAILTLVGLALPDSPSSLFAFNKVDTTPHTPYEVFYPRELHVHIFFTSVLEVVISCLSLKISWKGIRFGRTNKLPVRTDGDGGYDVPEISRPDILENHDNRSTHSNVLRELYKLQKSSILANDDVSQKIMSKFYSVNPTGLPQPESQKEYRERIEKFLASNDDESPKEIRRPPTPGC